MDRDAKKIALEEEQRRTGNDRQILDLKGFSDGI
jgi:hypothetical protein